MSHLPLVLVLCLLSVGCLAEEPLDLFGPGFKPPKPPVTPPADNLILEPIILIPGLVGSGLNMKLQNAKTPGLLCKSNEDWFRVWITPSQLVPPLSSCFFYNMALNFDADTNTWSNQQGVSIQPIDFGGVNGINYLGYVGSQPIAKTAYFETLIVSLMQIGYVPGVNVRGAPYDWRLAYDPDHFNEKLKQLIEETYELNNQTKVNVLAHSMGNLEFNYFLTNFDGIDAQWKQKYLGAFLSAAAPFSGASRAVQALVSGVSFSVGGITIDRFQIRDLVQSYGAAVWMLPNRLIGDQPIVVTPTKNYTTYMFADLFHDINATVTNQIYAHLVTKVYDTPDPEVEIYCMYGTGKETALWFEYPTGDLNDEPITYYGDGDGIVPIQSLEKCKDFNPVETKEFYMLSHTELIQDPFFIQYIISLITQPATP